MYTGLIDQVMTAVRMARNKGETALDEALARLYAIIERSLVCRLRYLQSEQPLIDFDVRRAGR